MPKNPTRSFHLVERIMPWMVLAILSIYTYANFTQRPYAGFEMTNGEVIQVTVDASDIALQVGDRVIRVGDIPIEHFLRNLRLPLIDGAKPSQHIPLLVERGDQTLTIDLVYPGPDQIQFLDRLNSQWWLPYIFWMAGTAALFFIRPKDTRWKLLIAFNFLTAIWLVTGSGPSKWHLWESAIVMRMAIWLCIPVYLHFHWLFPRPLKRVPKAIWGSMYAICTTLALAQWFEFLPVSSYLTGLQIALLGSILILVAHAIFQKEDRKDIGWLVLVASLILIPIIGSIILNAIGTTHAAFIRGGSLLALPALPGAYFFVAYLRQMPSKRSTRRWFLLYLVIILVGTLTIISLSVLDFQGNLFESTFGIGVAMIVLGGFISMVSFTPFVALPALAHTQTPYSTDDIEIRANRLLSMLLIIVIIAVTFGLLILVLSSWLNFPGAPVIVGILAAVTASLLAIFVYPSLERFVDHKILGIPLPQKQLGKIYIERITTSLTQKNLSHLIQEELLPSLLVRQSALLRVENQSLKPLYLMGVEDCQLPNHPELSRLIDEANMYRPVQDDDPFPWIRLILPLTADGKLRGFWLLGRRDPDDYYAPGDIDMLATIANQTAIALVNIEQADRLRALYQANIERHEEERASLARNLHDDVLNQLAAMVIEDGRQRNGNLISDYQSLSENIRQMISNLRPAMLIYGLVPALDELSDDLSQRSEDLEIELDISPKDGRYDPMIEAHLYRIVQQAAENALRHAQASRLRIHGRCAAEGVQLIVEDDGIGFEGTLNFNQLLADRHFGLAGMHERAGIVGGELSIMSAPGKGTKAEINWTPPN